MKLTRTIVLIFVLAVSLSLVSAQDIQDSYVAPEGLTGTYVNDAAAGQLVETEDGFQLVLEDVNEYGAWVVNAPMLGTARYSVEGFAGDWSFTDELGVSAVLNYDDVSINFTLSNAELDLDTMSLSFDAMVDGATGLEEVKGELALPESFDENTLFVVLDETVANALVNARIERLSTARAGLPCLPICT